MLNVICTVYQRVEPIKILIGSFLVQSSSKWKLYIIHDGPAPEKLKEYMAQYKNNNFIEFTETEKVNGYWGHPNRNIMLRKMILNHSDFLLITNDDNYYVPKFVEYFLLSASRGPKTGMVYCDMIHSHLEYGVLKSRIEIGFVDMGSFIVRIDVAKKVGFKYINMAADGQFAIDCHKLCRKMKLRVNYIEKPLFVHN